MKNLHAKDAIKYQVVELCGLFGVSKQAYYKYDELAAAHARASEAFALEYTLKVRSKDHGIGGVKVWGMYAEYFKEVPHLGRDAFLALLDAHGLMIRIRFKKPHTTDSTHGLPTYPNIVKDLIPTRPNQLWVSDLTYIAIWLNKTEYIFCYLTLIMDAYTKEIVGYSVGPSLEAKYSVVALKMALKRLEGIPPEDIDLIHHSDRGIQYVSEEYTKILKASNIRISMTETGDPKDNAEAERLNNTIKNELWKGVRFTSMKEVIDNLCDTVDFYNNERPHMSLDLKTPAEAALGTGEIKKRWVSRRENAIKEKQRTTSSLLIPENSLPLSTNWQESPSGLFPSVNP